jgi:hypothetical protein
MLIGDVRVETQPRILTVASVHIASGVPAFCYGRTSDDGVLPSPQIAAIGIR